MAYKADHATGDRTPVGPGTGSGGKGGGNGGKKSLKDYQDPTAEDLMHGDWPSGPSAGAKIERKGSITGRTENVDDLKAFKKATEEYTQRSPLVDVLDVVAGPFFDANEPDFHVPESFTGGHYHTSTDVGGVVGDLLGGAVGGPLGSVVGAQLGGLLGLDVYHGGADEESGAGADMVMGDAGAGGGDGEHKDMPDETATPPKKKPPRLPPKPTTPFSLVQLGDVRSLTDWLTGA